MQNEDLVIVTEDDLCFTNESYPCLSNDTVFVNISLENNYTNSTELPAFLNFDQSAVKDIIAYSVLFVIAAVGNLTVFGTLYRSRHLKSRVNLMIMHLAAADLIVTFILIPIEIGWRLTTQWVAGNTACKILQFFRAFGLYLSSMVLVCISLDRYFAILHPLKVNDARRRGKLMLNFAWTTAAVCSIPQTVIFSVQPHPIYSSFKQCVTFNFFRPNFEEAAYNLFCLAFMYFLPLFIIFVVYVRILWEISQKSKDSKEDCKQTEGGQVGAHGYRLRLRRSNMTNIERARARTLKMTIIIVLAFIWCWTPYVVITLWYTFDRESAKKIDRGIQDVLFIMVVSNSCVNPLVYGTYNLKLKTELSRCFGKRKPSQHLVRRPTASTALRSHGSNVFNSSVSSRHPPHSKVSGDGSICSRNSRLTRDSIDLTNMNYMKSKLHSENKNEISESQVHRARPHRNPFAHDTSQLLNESDIKEFPICTLVEDEESRDTGSLHEHYLCQELERTKQPFPVGEDEEDLHSQDLPEFPDLRSCKTATQCVSSGIHYSFNSDHSTKETEFIVKSNCDCGSKDNTNNKKSIPIGSLRCFSTSDDDGTKSKESSRYC